MTVTVKLDRKGAAEVLKLDGVQNAVTGIARVIAADVRSQKPGADVVVDEYTTDRDAASVTIRDARGRIWQARDGILTKAAARAGYEVVERKR